MWGRLIGDTFLRPRAAARDVLRLDFGAATVVEAAIAVTCVNVVLGYVGLLLAGGPVDPVSNAVLRAPLAGALLEFAVMIAVALLTFRVGRGFGGKGGVTGALTIVVWLNAVMLFVQAAQLAALVLAPPLATLIAVAALVWLLWAFTGFVTELHEFESPAMVLGVVVLTMIVIVFGLTLLAAILGIAPQGV
jgi:hypothetical protein